MNARDQKLQTISKLIEQYGHLVTYAATGYLPNGYVFSEFLHSACNVFPLMVDSYQHWSHWALHERLSVCLDVIRMVEACIEMVSYITLSKLGRATCIALLQGVKSILRLVLSFWCKRPWTSSASVSRQPTRSHFPTSCDSILFPPTDVTRDLSTGRKIRVMFPERQSATSSTPTPPSSSILGLTLKDLKYRLSHFLPFLAEFVHIIWAPLVLFLRFVVMRGGKTSSVSSRTKWYLWFIAGGLETLSYTFCKLWLMRASTVPVSGDLVNVARQREWEKFRAEWTRRVRLSGMQWFFRSPCYEAVTRKFIEAVIQKTGRLPLIPSALKSYLTYYDLWQQIYLYSWAD